MIEKVFLWVLNFDPTPRDALEYALIATVWSLCFFIIWTWKKRRK